VAPEATVNVLPALVIIVPAWIAALVLLIALLYRRGVRIERREADERAWRLAHPIHVREGAVKPAEKTGRTHA
jgi:hypothetical protein